MSRPSSTEQLLRKYGMTRGTPEMLILRRQRCGTGFRYVDAKGSTIKDAPTITRLRSLAVPPAYANVRYAADPAAHLQAVGEDAAGRLQYRYHPSWIQVREALKARRLENIASTLPVISRAVRRFLRGEAEGARHAAAAVVHLVAKTALRAGSDAYARERGTRGATTLLKSNVEIDGLVVRLHFRGKGAKMVTREVEDRTLATTCKNLLALPGRRLFQYRRADGGLHAVTASDVNAFLREVSGVRVSLKDFRTLVASAGVMKALSEARPVETQRARKALLRDAIAAAAHDLTNTPTVCRKSYVHDTVIAAFEQGDLPPPAGRTLEGAAQALAAVVARHR